MNQIVQGHPFISGGWWRLKMTSQGGRSGGGWGAEARLAAVWDTFYGQQCCQVYSPVNLVPRSRLYTEL